MQQEGCLNCKQFFIFQGNLQLSTLKLVNFC